MKREEIEQRVIAIAAEQAGRSVKDVTADSHFVNDLAFDSLDCVELIMEVEEEFDIQIPDGEAEKLLTVRLAVDYIEKALTPA